MGRNNVVIITNTKTNTNKSSLLYFKRLSFFLSSLIGRRPKLKMNQKQNKGKTPYQGKNRTFGIFKCNSCNREWMSGNSWANIGQNCKKCMKIVYPYKQSKLEKAKDAEKIDLKREHPQWLCQKCIKLGFPCNR